MRKLAEESFVVEFVKRIRKKAPGIGGGKLWRMYANEFCHEHSVGYNRFYDILEKYSLKVRKRRRRTQTTDSSHGLPTYRNLIKRLIPTRPNQVWVSDITYMTLHKKDKDDDDYKFCYLSLITDYYTKEIIGWCVGDTPESKFAILNLKKALKRLNNNQPQDIIHHSDRGVQYASLAYTDILKAHNIRISMTECGDPKDNAVAERINGIIKHELLMGLRFRTIKDVRTAIVTAVNFYNNERPHMSLNWQTPAQAAGRTGEIEKKWVSYRENFIKNTIM